MIRIAVWKGPMADLNGTVHVAYSFWMDDDGLHVRTALGVATYPLDTFDGVGVAEV